MCKVSIPLPACGNVGGWCASIVDVMGPPEARKGCVYISFAQTLLGGAASANAGSLQREEVVHFVASTPRSRDTVAFSAYPGEIGGSRWIRAEDYFFK